jgi:hypothetical protein
LIRIEARWIGSRVAVTTASTTTKLDRVSRAFVDPGSRNVRPTRTPSMVRSNRGVFTARPTTPFTARGSWMSFCVGVRR